MKPRPSHVWRARIVWLHLVCSAGSSRAVELVAITELLRNPAGLETAAPGGRSHEFVEVANLGTVPLSLDSLYLSDGLDADSVIPWTDPHRYHPGCLTGARVLPPGRTAVIIDPEYDSAVGLDRLSAYGFADSTVLWTVGDNHLGDYSNLAETDGVYLYKGAATTATRLLAWAADSAVQVPPEPGSKLVFADAGPVGEGVSVVLRSLLFGGPRYAACPVAVSPGTVECLHDGWLIDAKAGEVSDGFVACTLAVLAAGGEATGATVAVERTDGSVAPIEARFLGSDTLGARWFAAQVPLVAENHTVTVTHGGAVVSAPLDLSGVWVPEGAVRINEVFPRGGDSGPEWFELVNATSMAVALDGWLFGDSEDSAALAAPGMVIAAGAFVVVTEDAVSLREWFPTLTDVIEPPVWHTLSNTRDSLCLWDRYGQCHECVYYEAGWYDDWERGSLERMRLSGTALNAGDWAPSDPPSPGQPNRTATWRSSGRALMEIGPAPFTPNNDGVNDVLAIRLQLPAGAAVEITLDGMDGREVRRFTPVSEPVILWDGRTGEGAAAPVGPFFVVARFSGVTEGPSLVRKRGVLWR